MSKLYLANCSDQNQIIQFRIPEIAKPFSQTVRIGEQWLVPVDLNPTQLDSVIKQLSRYGLTDAKKIRDVLARIPYIYAIDKMVAQGDIIDGAQHNRGVLRYQGKDLREKAALAAEQSVQSHTPTNMPVEVEIEEIDRGTGESQDPPIAEGFRMDRQSNNAPSQNSRKKRLR